MSESAPGGTGPQHIEVIDNPRDRYYELRVDGVAAGLLVYESLGSHRVLTHTTVQEDYRGHGLAHQLIRAALDDLSTRNVTVSNHCTVVGRFVDDNPQYQGLFATRSHNG
jgi:predicted GNAT family acetyltransferase